MSSQRQIQNYKSLSHTRNDVKNNERILDMYLLKKPKEMTNKYNSFVDREAMREGLHQGVTLGEYI